MIMIAAICITLKHPPPKHMLRIILVNTNFSTGKAAAAAAVRINLGIIRT